MISEVASVVNRMYSTGSQDISMYGDACRFYVFFLNFCLFVFVFVFSYLCLAPRCVLQGGDDT